MVILTSKPHLSQLYNQYQQFDKQLLSTEQFYKINAVVYFIVGIVLYKISERRAMNRGLLGQY